ncbi:MAG: 50S ribosomal protein L23 [Bacilli bacterium]
MARTKKAEAVKSTASIHDFDVIIRPIITEKSMKAMQEENKVTLEVKPNANKIQIRIAFEKIFNVKVNSVAITNVVAKSTTRGGKYKGFIGAYKKAIVTVAEGQAIDLFKE